MIKDQSKQESTKGLKSLAHPSRISPNLYLFPLEKVLFLLFKCKNTKHFGLKTDQALSSS